jgi:2-polyprenyl-6-methoxyphenol hydroxylase-like FAD-dependent oxidoreductase
MSVAPVLIAGGGIGGLTAALTLHQIGVPCRIFEAVEDLKPLGVGINLQPNGVRELYDLGIGDEQLAQVGVRCREWALVGLNGNDIYAEPRGLEAGYNWPQYSVHRGEFHMLLLQTVLDRLGEDVFHPGHRVTAYRNDRSGVTISVEVAGKGREVSGSLLIGADGIHSAIRAQMYPDQPPIHWGGAIMWRGTSLAAPVRTGASFVGLGTNRQRVVFYPISPPDPVTGLATINWIAEITEDSSEGWAKGDWNRKVDADDVTGHFEGWDFGWLDVPALIRSSAQVLEYPMIDRDPIPTWRDGNVVLLGDAAHPMYPTGSNGATQAIVDARVLGRAFLDQGVNVEALQTYDGKLCDEISAVVLRNRGAGPFGILNIVDERCGSVFDDINEVMTAQEMAAFMAGYKQAAGYAIDTLNASPPTIPAGAV